MGALRPNESLPSLEPQEVETTAVDASIVVEACLPHVYRRWLAIEKYPQFIHAVQRVRKLDATHFALRGDVDGEPFDVTLEIMLRVPDRRIAWRLLHDHLTTGVVSFLSLPRNRTHLNLKIMSSSGGVLTAHVERYLAEFKTVLESRCQKCTGL
jgi:uncharacterized membrane protein